MLGASRLSDFPGRETVMNAAPNLDLSSIVIEPEAAGTTKH